MNILEKYDRPFIYGGILMNLFLSLQIFILWYSPNLNEAGKIYTAVWLIIFEFFLVHSSLITAVLPKKVSIPFLFVFYGSFAWLFNSKLPGNIILIVYMIMVFNRMRFAFYEVDPKTKRKTKWLSGMAIATYFVLAFIIGFGNEYVSKLGLTDSYLSLSGYNGLKLAGGEFIDHPHLALSLGSIYYFLLSIQEGVLLNIRKANQTGINNI